MRMGIFGAPCDPQVVAVAREAAALGADIVVIASDALERGEPASFTEAGVIYRGEPLDDLRSFYVRQVPMPNAAAVERDGELHLYRDWFVSTMQSRERSSFYLAWLLRLERDGALVVNPPQAGSVLQSKAYQLHVLAKIGARIPRTLISNDPSAVRSFAKETRQIVFKPLMGGALTRELDAEALERLESVRASPVIFQERVFGDDVRVMVIDGEVVSSVAIDTPDQHLDFRADPVYSQGAAVYRETILPEPIRGLCREAACECGLRFAGIDIKHHGDDWVFLELNSSPIYMDVELKLGHPISRGLAFLLVHGPARNR